MAIGQAPAVRPDASLSRERLPGTHYLRTSEPHSARLVVIRVAFIARGRRSQAVSRHHRAAAGARTSLQSGRPVQHNGDRRPGIGGRDVEHMFQALYTTKAGGMGIGLTIARSIVEAHGGELEAEDNPGGGATFSFKLPVSEGGP